MESRKILFVTWDGAGNIPPELTVCRALSDAGHKVTVLSHAVLRSRFEAAGATYIPIRRAGQLDSTSPEETLVDRAEALFGPLLVEEAREAMLELQPHLTIADSMLVPVNALFAQSAGPSVAFHHTLARFLFGGMLDQLSYSMKAQMDELLTAQGLESYPRPIQAVSANDVILTATFEAFDQPDEGLPSNLVHVGPLRMPGASEDPRDSQRRNPHKPRVIVSLSTSFMDQRELLQRLADALAELPSEAMITTGPAIDPSDLSLADNVGAVRFAPHDQLLRDADLLITHAGHGTVAAGALFGVPMLCIPMGRDQPMVADRARELGLTRVCQPDADRPVLTAAIQAALADSALKDNARNFQQAAQSHPGVDEVVKQCEGLMG